MLLSVISGFLQGQKSSPHFKSKPSSVLCIAPLHMAVRATYSRNLLLIFMTYFQLEVSFQGLKGCDTSKASQLNGVTNHNTEEKLLVMRD